MRETSNLINFTVLVSIKSIKVRRCIMGIGKKGSGVGAEVLSTTKMKATVRVNGRMIC